MAVLAGELAAWPTKDEMATLLRSAGLTVVVGRYSVGIRYSVSVQGRPHFSFQEYGGDLGDPVISADSESVSELLAVATLVSEALASAGFVHRFELYDDANELVGYLHHRWPLPTGE